MKGLKVDVAYMDTNVVSILIVQKSFQNKRKHQAMVFKNRFFFSFIVSMDVPFGVCINGLLVN